MSWTDQHASFIDKLTSEKKSDQLFRMVNEMDIRHSNTMHNLRYHLNHKIEWFAGDEFITKHKETIKKLRHRAEIQFLALNRLHHAYIKALENERSIMV